MTFLGTSAAVLDAVRRAAAGEPLVAPAVLARMMDRFSARAPVPVRLPPGYTDLSESGRSWP